MRVLLVEPLKHPIVLDIADGLDEIRSLINCDYIECVHPFEKDVVLICDDCGAISGKQLPNRKVNNYIIFGPFIICGVDDDDFKSLDEDLLLKYKEMFFHPEIFKMVMDKIEVIKLIKRNEA